MTIGLLTDMCKFPGCSGKHKAKGYCNKHYIRLQRHGSVDDTVGCGGSVKDRFERIGWTLTSTGCWEWNGAKNSDGYGSFRVNKVMVGTHRVSYSIYVDSDIDGQIVCHTCDNPPCVNPAHLFLGTQNENIQDCVTKGRRSPQGGSKNHNTKLTEIQVDEIRKLWDRPEKVTQQFIADRYNVSQRTISLIVRGETWVES